MFKNRCATLLTVIITSISLHSFTVSATTLNIDIEEARLETASQHQSDIVEHYSSINRSLIAQYSQQTDELLMTQMIASHGTQLWQQAVQEVQRVHSGRLDDRPLYWGRLILRKTLKQYDPNFKLAPWQRQVNLNVIERASRGFSDIKYDETTDKKILLTGFDPFHLDKEIKQSNPSGLAALALDGYKFELNGKTFQIETVIMPVRFADFDQGIVESLLTPIYRDNSVDLILTTSMGREQFDLERFAGRNRSAAAMDNQNKLTGASKTKPLPPMFNEKPLYGPEFVEFSIPLTAIDKVTGQWKVNDNRKISATKQDSFEAQSLLELQNLTSVEGSGGGYLSNEISYRAILLQHQLGSHIPVGHIHTPKVSGYDAVTEQAIVQQLTSIVTAIAADL